jgi:hypothetical protein
MAETTIVIAIHGLANKPDEGTKRAWYKLALIEGLKRNCARTVEDMEFDLVYWADLRYPAPDPKPEPYFAYAGAGPLPAYKTHKWDLIVGAAQSVFGSEIDFLERHTGIAGPEDFVLEKTFTDLDAYYQDIAGFRGEVRARLAQKLQDHRGKRIMLIAHSMGSIIAYDVLRLLGRADPGFRIDHLVTIGSPLGLPRVKAAIYRENDLVRTPSIVGRWSNFADRRDLVALDAKLGDDYEANDQGVKVADIPVINLYVNPEGKANYHESYGYLRTPELSEIVRGFI